MLTNSIFGSCNSCGCNNGWGGCNSCGCGCGCGNNSNVLGASTGGCGCNNCGCGCGNNLGNSAFNFVGDWVNIVVTLTILQSILGLVCNWNCGCNN